jgi:hypothetical protein
MELVLQLSDGLVLGCHLGVDAVRFFHHLIDYKLRVPSNLEAPNTYLDSNLEPVEESFILSDIVGYW